MRKFNGSIHLTTDGRMVNDNDEDLVIITLEEYTLLTSLKEARDEGNKHLKGYIFDSLVYRYKLALEEAVQTRADKYTNFCIKRGFSKPRKEIEAHVREHVNQRDEMRFIQILDEAIGEHD